jgi:hypothetical protein
MWLGILLMASCVGGLVVWLVLTMKKDKAE